MQAVTVFFGSLSFLFLLTSTILMISSNCTIPTSEEIYFMRTTMSAALTRQVLGLLPPGVAVFDRITVRIGLLGYCINDTCSQYRLGYRLPALLMGGPIGAEFLSQDATTALVINPLFTAFSSVCLVAMMISLLLKKPAIVFILMIMNTIIAIICLIIDLAIFVRAYYLVRYSEAGLLGLVSVQYGNALWLMVAAVVLTILSTLFFACTLHRVILLQRSSVHPPLVLCLGVGAVVSITWTFCCTTMSITNLQPVFLSSPNYPPQPQHTTTEPLPSSSTPSPRTHEEPAEQPPTDGDSNHSSPHQHYPRPIRLRKGTRLEDAYPSIFAGLGDQDPDPTSLLASLESPFQLQEYIAHLVRADPHAVARIVRLPSPLVQREVWIYEQLRRLAHDLGHPLVSALQGDCNRAKCPEMKAGEWLYLCAAHATANENECCAIDYIVHTLDGATSLLNSARYFPSRLQIPASSIKHFTAIARRLYRILAHAWFHHRELFEECETETSLYARFLALADEFGLISEDLLVIPRGNEEVNNNNDENQFNEGEQSVEEENELSDVTPAEQHQSFNDDGPDKTHDFLAHHPTTPHKNLTENLPPTDDLSSDQDPKEVVQSQ